MNWDIAEGKWDQFKAVLRTQWGKLTDDDLEQAKGRRDNLLAKIQEHYGEARDAVESKLDALIAKL
jgi:uncharacterized protein YjbJ (UPF0337 family)